MTYHQRIRDIQRNFVMGHQDRETCLALFDALLHEYGLLPKDEGIDRAITNDNFIGLLKLALNYRDPKSNRDPETTKDPGANYLDSLHDINKMLGGGTGLAEPTVPTDPFTGIPHAANLAGMITRRCPVCQKTVSGLFNQIRTADSNVLPIDPPRCEECMLKWMEKEVGYSLRPKDSLAEPWPSVTKDDSPVLDLGEGQAEFFAQFEQEMKDFKL
jgi:hypothetical protein